MKKLPAIFSEMIEDPESHQLQDRPFSFADAINDQQASSGQRIEALLFDVDAAKQIKPRNSSKGQKRFAVYARFSRSTQKQSSIERQNDNCLYYIGLVGGVAVEFFQDRGKSAATAKGRHGLATMLNRLQEFDAIVFEDFDRFSRELYDAVEIYERLEKAGIELHSAIDERHLNKTDVTQAASRAEYDRVRRRNLTSAGLSQLVRDGGIPSGACFGYRDTDTAGFPEPDPAQAAVVIKIFKLAGEGMTFAKIARQLTDDGDLTPSGSTKWNSSGVETIVHRPIYTGRILYRRVITIKDRKSDRVELRYNVKERVERNYNERYRIVTDKQWVDANRVRRRKGRPKKRDEHTRSAHLFGNAVCDCPGAEEQRYWPGDKVAGRLNCNLATRRASCFATVQSMEIEHVERAIVQALVKEAEHSFIQEDFGRFYDERIAEQIKLYSDRVAATERELDEAQAFLQRTFHRDLREGYSGRTILRNRQDLESRVVHLEAQLGKLLKARAAVSDNVGRSAEISRAFSLLTLRLPFRVQNESDAAFLKMFRKLVPEICIERHGRPRGEFSVVMKVVWDALLTDDDDSISEASSIVLRADAIQDIKYGLNESAQLSMEEHAAKGTYALSDEQWALVEGRLPDTEETDHHGRRDTSTKTIVNALVFKLTTGVPLSRLPVAFGQRNLVYNAILRFIYAGGVERLRMLLQERYPDMVAAWDLASVAKFRRAEEVAAVPRVVERPALLAEKSIQAGEHRLTDAQWRAVENLIDVSVKVPVGRPPCRIPVRTLLELVLLKLRTRCAWGKVPTGEFGFNEFLAAAYRLSYTGTWDRVVKVWSRDFPELVEGVDTTKVPRPRSCRLGLEGVEEFVRKPEDSLALRIWDPQGEFKRASADDWTDLTNREWSIIAEVLPPLSRRRHRTFVDAILFIMATRTAWQQLPAKYGSRSSIYKLFGRFAQQDEDGSCVIHSIITALEANSPQTLERMGRLCAQRAAPQAIISPVVRLRGKAAKSQPINEASKIQLVTKLAKGSPQPSKNDVTPDRPVASQLDLFS